MTDTWHRLDLAGHPIDVYDPATPVRFGLLYLHSYGRESIRSRPAFVAEIERRGWACASPDGGPSWWLDRPCTEFDPSLTAESHLRNNVVPFFARRWGIAPRRLAVVGVSMGGQAALRLGLLDSATFPVVASISGTIDFHELHGHGTPMDAMFASQEEARNETALLLVQGRQMPPWLWFGCDPDDAWFPGNERLADKLGASGVPHVAEFGTRIAGHSYFTFDALAPKAFAFLGEGLETESRRLL